MTSYLAKRAIYPALISEVPNKKLFNIIVIPCFNEPDIIETLSSLRKCDQPKSKVEVIIVVNSSELAMKSILEQNENSVLEIKNFSADNPELFFDIHVLHIKDLPKKNAGVGLARKIGMDEALYRFEKIDKENDFNGIITCLDADCTVHSNYLVEIEKCFQTNTKCPGASIRYAHEIDSNVSNTKEIIDYELHLRYYNQGLKFAGLPYAYQTVGSAMAVSSREYQRQGGMNKRKAGEDFYFLHKFIQLNDFQHIATTTVYPSSRTSDRVPFGTGRAMLQMKEDNSGFKTYKFSAFLEIKNFLERIDELYQGNIDILSFVQSFQSNLSDYIIKTSNYLEDWQKIIKNTSSLTSFRKRFFVWMNAFWVMKFLNQYRIEQGGGEVYENARMLFEMIHEPIDSDISKKALLKLFRLLERE